MIYGWFFGLILSHKLNQIVRETQFLAHKEASKSTLEHYPAPLVPEKRELTMDQSNISHGDFAAVARLMGMYVQTV